MIGGGWCCWPMCLTSCFRNQTKWQFYHTAHLCLKTTFVLHKTAWLTAVVVERDNTTWKRFKKAPFVTRENWDNCSWSCHSADIAGSKLCPTFGTTTLGYHTTTRMTYGMCQKTLLGIKKQRLRVFQFGLLQETSANSIVHVIATSWCGSTYSTKRYWKLCQAQSTSCFANQIQWWLRGIQTIQNFTQSHICNCVILDMLRQY